MQSSLGIFKSSRNYREPIVGIVPFLGLLVTAINQSGALLLSVGDHDLSHISIPHRFNASVTLPTLRHFVSPSNIFSRCFPLLHFPSFNPLVTRCFNLSLLITWPKKVACCLSILFMSELYQCKTLSHFLHFLV